MPLNYAWVDRIFTRLAVRYGAAFLRQWPDADAEIIKADWSDVLEGVSGDSIIYALQYLPDTPVNAMQFRAICKRSPRSDTLRLPEPPADPAAIRRVAETMAESLEKANARRGTPARLVLERLCEIADQTGLNSAQRSFARKCVTMLQPGDQLRDRLARHGVAQEKQGEAA